MNLETLVHAYKCVTAAIKDLDDKQNKLEGEKEQLAQAILKTMQQQGISSVRTEHGLVMQHTPPARFFSSDMPAFREWVVQHKCADLFENRLHQGNVKAWLDSNPELIPPGLQSETKPTTISLRK